MSPRTRLLRRRLHRLALAGALLLAGCAPGAAWDGPRQALAPALLPGAAALLGVQQVSDAAVALERAFDDPIAVTLQPGAGPARSTPAHCTALLGLQPRISGTVLPADWAVLQQRLADCQALRWLAGAATARHNHLPPDWRSARDTAQWPAALWPAVSADEVATLARPGQTLGSVSQRPSWLLVDAARGPAPVLQLQAQGYILQIQWLAQGDFDGDGWQDWLLRWQAQVVDGTWRATRCLLLSRQAAQGPFSLRPDPALR